MPTLRPVGILLFLNLMFGAIGAFRDIAGRQRRVRPTCSRIGQGRYSEGPARHFFPGSLESEDSQDLAVLILTTCATSSKSLMKRDTYPGKL